MREIIESIHRRQRADQLFEAKVDQSTAGKDISSIATMMSVTMKALKKNDITILVARKRIEAIMTQYLFTMKDSTWDSLRDEFINADDNSKLAFAQYLKQNWQTVPNVKSGTDVQKLAKEWAMEINRGGYDFGIMMALKPGMRRLKPKDDTIKAYDDAANATDPDSAGPTTPNPADSLIDGVSVGDSFSMPYGGAALVPFKITKIFKNSSDGSVLIEAEYANTVRTASGIKTGMVKVNFKYDNIKSYVLKGSKSPSPAPAAPAGTEDDLKNVFVKSAKDIAATMAMRVAVVPELPNLVISNMNPIEKIKFTNSGVALNDMGLQLQQRLLKAVQEMVVKEVEALIESKKW
jgi:hypothetical protein